MYVCAFGLQSEAHRVRRVGKEEASFSLSLFLFILLVHLSVRRASTAARRPLSLSEAQKKRLSLCSHSALSLSRPASMFSLSAGEQRAVGRVRAGRARHCP